MLNDQSVLDVRKLITGKDGLLFIKVDGRDIPLAEVDTFTAQMSVTNTDYQPVGSALVYGVSTGYSVTLTLTEAVIRDDLMINKLIEELKFGYFPTFDFQGTLRRRDTQEERIVFRNCIPDGSVDLMNITPGEIVKRSWSFRVNGIPEMATIFNS